jgi:hypothetical protein
MCRALRFGPPICGAEGAGLSWESDLVKGLPRTAAVGLVVVVSSCAGGSPPAAQLTGYRSVTVFKTSGAVSVDLTRSQSERVFSLIAALPEASHVDCMDPLDLDYRVTVVHAKRIASGTVITGYRCAALVIITRPGSKPAGYVDTKCKLDNAIRGILPPAAAGTRGTTVGCH